MTELARRLREQGVLPTAQRLQIAQILFERPAHFSADEIYARANALGPRVSKATVYNTLGLFVRRGLVREVLVDPSKVFYDSNVEPHFHFYETASGRLIDIDAEQVDVRGFPAAPEGTVFEGVDVIIRVRADR